MLLNSALVGRAEWIPASTLVTLLLRAASTAQAAWPAGVTETLGPS